MLEISISLGLWLFSTVPAGLPGEHLVCEHRPRSAPAAMVLGLQNGSQGGQDIAAFKKALLETGIEARGKRHAAVQGLLLLPDVKAHSLLQDMLRRGGDPDDLSLYILGALAEKWPQDKDPVFGSQAADRFGLIQSYVTVFVSYFSTDPKVQPTNVTDELEKLALNCMRGTALSASERKQIFTQLTVHANPGVAEGAMRAAAGCQDLGLAPILAEHLNRANAVAARQALADLTFVEEEFTSEEDFNTWWSEHKKSYRELAYEAASRSVEALQALRSEKNKGLTRQTVKLIKALLNTASVEWSRVQLEVLEGEPSSSQSTYLEAVLSTLRARPSIVGVSQERLAFAKALETDFNAQGASDTRRALLLECLAHLAPNDATELRSTVEGYLIAALTAEQKPAPRLAALRLAALRGFQGYPSAENLVRVIEVGQAAIRDLPIAKAELEAVLQCLQSDRWHAPESSEGQKTWLEFIGAVFDETDADVSVQLKQSAGGAAVVADASGKVVPAAFDRLLKVIKSVDQSVILRRQLINRVRAFQDGRYTAEISELIQDASPEIRLEAATQLKNFPKSGNAKTNTNRVDQIARSAVARFAEETDDRVLAALVDCLLRMAEDEGQVVTLIIGHLRTITDDVVASNKPDDVRKKHLVKLLRDIAGDDSLEPGQWCLAAKMLVSLEERNALLIVLRRQQAIGTSEGVTSELVVLSMNLIIDTALMLPAGKTWDDPKLAIEANEVRTALENLRTHNRPRDTTETRVLHVAVLGGLRRYEEMLALARTYIDAKDISLSKPELASVYLDYANGLLRKGELTAAAKALTDRSVTAAWTPRALDIADATAKALWTTSDKQKAIPLLETLATKTPADAVTYPERFLRYAEARFDLDPAGTKGPLRAELESKQGLFDGNAVAEDLKTRWQALYRKVR